MLGAFLLPFLAIAFVILYIFPTETGRLFAWDIKPPMTAMMLAAAYAGGIWFFVRVLGASSWHEVHIGFPAVGTFASILGVTTIAHWDRFMGWPRCW